MTPLPPYTPADRLDRALREAGHAVLDAASLAARTGLPPALLASLAGTWGDLPPDAHLRDGGRYRRRRHASFTADGDSVLQVPHRAHWQPLEYNALHGGLERWFAPIEAATVAHPAWMPLIAGFAAAASALRGRQTWFVEAHQFRIDTTDGIGRPTPEGAHRDGVDLVVVALIDRVGVKGGETRIFDAEGPSGIRFTMTTPWTVVVLDDARMIHETTPIQPLAPGAGHRDTLVLTYRAGGFQGPDVAPREPSDRAFVTPPKQIEPGA